MISTGRFVILLQGRHAGQKAVILQAYPEATEARKYPHAVVLGIEETPKQVTKAMSQEQLVKRTQVKCFVKTVNCNHFLVTRHVLKDDDFFQKVNPADIIKAMGDPAEKKAALQKAAQVLRQKYLNNRVQWFFKKLHF